MTDDRELNQIIRKSWKLVLKHLIELFIGAYRVHYATDVVSNVLQLLQQMGGSYQLGYVAAYTISYCLWLTVYIYTLSTYL